MDSGRPPLVPACPTLPEYVRHWAETTPDRRAFTFVEHPAQHSRGVHRTLTWRRLDVRVRALAARLADETDPGDRVALLCPQGTEYVTAFLAALAAGLVAVPLYTPGLSGHADRLAGVLADARPSVVVTTSRTRDEVRDFLGTGGPRIVVADEVPDDEGRGREPVAPDPGTTAYLQYTSGSTRAPAGVEISHGNVVANALQALSAYGLHTRPMTSVGWLPLYHDMGLVLSVAAPVARGALSVLMDPAAFLHEPVRWLRLLAAHPDAVSAAPNFAYDYSFSSYKVNYPAGLSPTSAARGNLDLVNHVKSQAAACPGQKFVLVGYSQGANVVDNSIGISSAGAVVGSPIVATLPAAVEPKVAAVLLFGNPIRALGKSVTGTYQSRTLDLCAQGDPVCENGGGDVGAHLSYRDDAEEAATFAAGRL